MWIKDPHRCNSIMLRELPIAIFGGSNASHVKLDQRRIPSWTKGVLVGGVSRATVTG